MTLSDEQRQIVTATFARVVPITNEATGLFYQRLWEIAPETRSMFKSTDMHEQGLKLMQTLGMSVRALHDLTSIEGFLRDLGARHLSYGVTKSQYALVKIALLWMLENCLGRDFTPSVREAWSAAYDMIADICIRAYDETA